MKKNLRVFTPLVFILLFNFVALAQNEKTESDSTSFERIMKKSSKELAKSNYNEKVQRKYAQIFYQYYLDHPNEDEKYREWALGTAFKFWANIGAADKVDTAMAHLDYNSKSWGNFLAFVPTAYVNSNQKSIKDAVKLFEKLTKKLTDPKSKSRAYWWLAGYYHDHNDVEKLKNAARAMINLNAIQVHVNQGLGYLYELKSLNVGQEAPHFQIKTVQGPSLSAPQNNKITLLEFWATWCGPCMGEIPHLKSIQSKYSTNNLQIIGISLDTDLEKLKQFIHQKRMSWPQIIQPKAWDDKITKEYNVIGIPKTYIIGQDGNIIAKDLRGEKLEKKIANLINQ